LIVAEGQEHIGVFGKGVIEGQGTGLFEALNRQIQKGYLTESPAQASPAFIAMSHCKDIRIEGLFAKCLWRRAPFFTKSGDSIKRIGH
jgi:hypothetical protein